MPRIICRMRAFISRSRIIRIRSLISRAVGPCAIGWGGIRCGGITRSAPPGGCDGPESAGLGGAGTALPGAGPVAGPGGCGRADSPGPAGWADAGA